jgi:hypothetical protein
LSDGIWLRTKAKRQQLDSITWIRYDKPPFKLPSQYKSCSAGKTPVRAGNLAWASVDVTVERETLGRGRGLELEGYFHDTQIPNMD